MLTVTPHPYQDEGIDLCVERQSALVAFDMGLGKTIVGLAAAEELLGESLVEMVMVVVPSNLRMQWAQSIARHTDVDRRTVTIGKEQLTIPTEEFCVVIDGTPKKRKGQYARVREHGTDYVILSYDSVVNDWADVKKINPDMIILDEATAIKTFGARRTKKIKRLTAPYRVALTGTPVENGKPEEIYSIMQWVDNTVLGRYDIFDKTYIIRNKWGGVDGYRNLPELNRKLKAVMCRKVATDPDVAPFMPKVRTETNLVPLDEPGKKLYHRIANDLQKALKAVKTTSGFDVHAHYAGKTQPGENTAMGRVAARQMALDMLCVHPDLLVASAMDHDDALAEQADGIERATWSGSEYAWKLWQEGLIDDVTDSPKLERTVTDINRIMRQDPKNKVIVFTFWKQFLPILTERLDESFGVVQYHGDMNGKQKAAAARRFESDPDCRVFVSSHAGGYGTDLWMANYLINVDQAHSSGTQDQINARHVRAASEFEYVTVINEVIENSVEVRRLDRLELKRRVGSAILDGEGADEHGKVANDVKSLSQYLDDMAA